MTHSRIAWRGLYEPTPVTLKLGIIARAMKISGPPGRNSSIWPSFPKPLRPRPPSAGTMSTSYLESFVAYVAGECHLADNTVAAYRRDTKRFFQWLQARAVTALTIRDLADYVGWLHGQKLNPTEHRPAHCLAESLFSLFATGRRAGGKPGRIAGQPEVVGASAEGPLAGPGQPPVRDAETGRPLLAARSGTAGTALRHRLPGLGTFPSETSRSASRRGLLHLSRQRRQAADGAAGGQGRRGRAGVSRARARPAGRAGFAAARVGPALLSRPPPAPRADLGAA